MGREQIKPCPFCGAHAVDVARTNKNACWIECVECDARTQGHKTRRGAIALWNHRAAPEWTTSIIECDMDEEQSRRTK